MAGEPTLLAKGLVEKIGLPVGSFTHKPEGKDKYVVEEPIADHTAGIDLILKALVDPKHGVIKALTDINAVGHRVALEVNSSPRAPVLTRMPRKRSLLAANWLHFTIPQT